MTKKTFKNLKILYFILIFVFCTTLQVTAQSPNINDYGVKYKAKIGDSNEYSYTTIYNYGKNYLTSYYPADNGTYLPVNVTTQSTITVTVVEINTSSTGTPQAFVRTKLKNPGQAVIINNNTYAGTYLIPAFDNKSIVEKFVSDLSSYYLNQSNPVNPFQYYVEGDYIKLDGSSNYTDTSNNIQTNIVSTSEMALNWKTGWLEYTQSKTVAENGTVLYNYKVERVSNNLVNDAINYSITGLTLASLGAVVIVPTITFYSYKKFAKSPKVANKNISFSQYIKSKGKKKPTNKIISPTGSTKALDMIDEILKENK